MGKSRLEAFSDGVIAIIITIMVLELKLPHDPADGPSHAATLADLKPLIPTFLAYVLSFIYVGIYWNNHHHLFHAVKHVRGSILWANLHCLFWLSLFPFVTNWAGDTHFASWPVAAYGLVLLASGGAWAILARFLVRSHGSDSLIAEALGRRRKETISIILYAAAIALAFFKPWTACAIYALVAAIWFIPDPRIEKRINNLSDFSG
jgi:uncharacterized membrane protein